MNQNTSGDTKVNLPHMPNATTAPIYAGAPPMPSPFIGRTEQLESIVEELLGVNACGHAVSLSSGGLAGIGLTSLAAAVAQHPRVREYFVDGVLWASLGQQADVLALLAQWAGELGLDVSTKSNINARAQTLKEGIGQRRLLLVIDDAWEAAQIRGMQCGGPNCGYLLTTHYRALARDFAGPEHYRLIAPLERSAAYELLQTLAPDVCAAEPDLARAVSVALGGLPLAIKLLAGYLAAPVDTRTSSGLRIARTARERLLLAQQRLGAGEHANTVLAQAIALSLTGLPPQTLRAFYDLGAFVPAPATFSAEAAMAVTAADAQTIEQIIARNLLEQISRENESVGTLAAAGNLTKLMMHTTIASVASVRRDPKTVARHRSYYLAYASRQAEVSCGIQDAYGQIMQAWAYAPDEPSLLEFVWTMRLYQERMGLQHVIARWTQRCISMPRLACAGANSQRTMELLEIVNRTLNIADGVTVARGAANECNHASVLFNIGSAYDILERREQALEYYHRAWPIQEQYGDREGLAITLNNIGSTYYELNLPGKALEFLRLSLTCREQNGDRTSAQYGQTLNNLGVIYTSLGMAKEALDHFTRSLSIHQALRDMAGEALTRSNLARYHHLRGPLSDAIAHMQRVVELDHLLGSSEITRHQAKLARLVAGLSPACANAPSTVPAQTPVGAISPKPPASMPAAPHLMPFAFIRRGRRQPAATP
jgi:tetratricopeptide (TPR) repeat protein